MMDLEALIAGKNSVLICEESFEPRVGSLAR